MDSRTIDSELKYCPHCNDEYRPEIQSCAACKQTLLYGADLLAARNAKNQESGGGEPRQSAAIEDDDTLVPLQSGSLFDMKRLKGLLETEAVPAVLIKEESCASGGCGGPRIIVQIREQDLQRAAAVLRRDHAKTTVIGDYEEVAAEAVYDPESALAHCPACGHAFAPEVPDCPECGLRFL